MRKSRAWIAGFAAIVIALGGWLMAVAYDSARTEAVSRLRYQARILAEQAARGLREYFDYFHNSLAFLAELPEVKRLDEDGKIVLKAFFENQGDQVRAVTRVGADGRIVWSWPDESVAGRDVSGQAHNQRLLETQKATLSSVFTAVQGYRAVALVVPVHDARGNFAGGLTILVPFEAVSRRYLEGISIGDSGYGLLLDREGIELYCPVPGHTGQSIYAMNADSPTILALADTMRKGGEGEGEYYYAETGARNPPRVKKLVHYAAAPILDSFWTVMVSVPEEEAYAFIAGFRDRWILLAIFFSVSGTGFCLILLLALDRNKAANAALAHSNAALRSAQERLVMSEKLAALGQVAAGISHQVNSPLGAVVSASRSLLDFASGKDLAEACEAYAGADPGLRALFDRLLERSSSRESSISERKPTDRAERAAAARELSAQGVGDPDAAADDLADMGLLADAADYAALLLDPRGAVLAAAARRLSSLRGSARVIREAAERASGVVGALGTYSRADRSREAALVDVGEELDMTLTLYVGASRPGISVKRRSEPGCKVRAVPDLLTQVWTNLVVNALQAMEGRGEIRLADTGSGIPSEIGDRVFEPFFTTKAPGEGSGLGLDIAKRIVEGLGGSITFDSRPGRTVFKVDLPEGEG
jgi:signal transduction histidine kinase